MKKQAKSATANPEARSEPFRVRLPGFLGEEKEVGLGDVIKRATTLAGIRPCAGCLGRADAMNRRVIFSGRRRP